MKLLNFNSRSDAELYDVDDTFSGNFPADSDNKLAAMAYVLQGRHVLPLWWVEDNGACGCGNANCRSVGKHPLGRLVPNGLHQATTDKKTISDWWERCPRANIGIATGPSKLLVVDIDSREGKDGKSLWKKLQQEHGMLPETLEQNTGGGGHHIIFCRRHHDGLIKSSSGDGLDIRADGGYIVAAPSNHKSGQLYDFPNPNLAPAPAPGWLCSFAATRSASKESKKGALPGPHRREEDDDGSRPYSRHAERELRDAIGYVKADSYEDWFKAGFAIKRLRWRDDIAFDIFHTVARQSEGYKGKEDCISKWQALDIDCHCENIYTINFLFKEARTNGWAGIAKNAVEIDEEKDEIVAGINKNYAFINSRGGKACILYEGTDEKGKPKEFYHNVSDFYHIMANKGGLYRQKAKSQEFVPCSKLWMQHPKRRSYQGITFDPSTSERNINGYYNAWQGFGVEPQHGDWSRMRHHIMDVLAAGDDALFEYILKWLAWAVQNPGKQSETALVFKGPRGGGKGTLGNVLLKMFGHHGLHLSSASLLAGRFSGHLENCAFVFADESLWAGDKSAEQQLKRMITEPTLMIEGKGRDAFPVANKLKIMMASNENWVAPVGPLERRFAISTTSHARVRDRDYFDALYKEIENGGVAAILYDLLEEDLFGWHPRYDIPETEALKEQARRSLSPEMKWLFSLLQDGSLPAAPRPNRASMADLVASARDAIGRKKAVGDQDIAELIKAWGAQKAHTNKGNVWDFPALSELRAKFDGQYGKQDWDDPCDWR